MPKPVSGSSFWEIVSGAQTETIFSWCEKFFKVLGWIAILAAVKYAVDRTHSQLLWLVYGVGSLLLTGLLFNLSALLHVPKWEGTVGWRGNAYLGIKLTVCFVVFQIFMLGVDTAINGLVDAKASTSPPTAAASPSGRPESHCGVK
ncbi:hypothetical protein ASC80_05570 [Afipia sp. Root123D2]|uniref:hypothetical protein n=1 Tax=Afipia sp. Root123D2 TaxID=1736436 RepID=UPI0006FECE8E|nr:hypothetical protein [Afipia sp. Root123D2]KQW22809.1 hypothetical protein ASC80_05570 [Afipia sp. Root123D2]